MTDYWRPGFPQEYRDKIEEFLEDNPSLPFDDAREFMKFCTNQQIMDVESASMSVEEQQEMLLEKLKEDLGRK